jgi:putative transcriptional regulator
MDSAPAYLSNHFLIAMPALADPNFARGLTLLCQHDETGAMGLLVNRPSDFTVGELLAQLGIDNEVPGLAQMPVLFGGPVHPDRGFVLHDDPREWNSTLRFGDGLAVTTSRDILVAMAHGDGPNNVLIALGYSGWDAGQLEAELGENAWLTAPADQAIVFRTPVAARWQAAASSLGVDLRLISDHSGRA